MQITEFIERLEGVKGSNNQYQARCPAHDDKSPSLSVSIGEHGNILIHCHAGCEVSDILQVMGLTMKDLYLTAQEPSSTEAEYIYYDEQDKEILKKVKSRKNNGEKTYFWKYHEGSKWVNGMNRITPPLYNQNALKALKTGQGAVFIVEGEKDVDTLKAFDFVAVSAPHGAGTGKNKWLPAYSQKLKGFDVVIIQDNDKPGKEFAKEIAGNLQNIANSIKVIDLTTVWSGLKNHGDISDVFELETDKKTVIDELKKLCDNTDIFEPESRIFQIISENKEVLEVLESLNPLKYTFDDKGLGELFADYNKDYARFNVTAKEWYVYNGKVWVEDTGGMLVSQRAKELADGLIIYGTTIEDDKQKSLYNKFVSKLGQFRCREVMIKDSKDKFYINSESLDKNLDLLNCQNGTLNLINFKFHPHRADDLLSKISNVSFDAGASSELWDKFIDEIMQGNSEKIDYLQKILGYTLTADTSLESCFILYGATTRNGKSTLVETIAYMLGNTKGYAMNMNPQTLAQKQNKDSRQASGDVARLNGCRFLNASEPPKRMLFDVALLKNLLGRDTITARHQFEREFEFIPHFKLFINTNHLPLIQDDTLFSSGRIVVISFDKHFSESEQDKGLKDKLKQPEVMSGIFNWFLTGLAKFNYEGAEAPPAIMESTAEYRNSSDKVGKFMEEYLRKSVNNSKASDVYEAYKHYCTKNGYGTDNKGNFFDELKNKNIMGKNKTVKGRTESNVVLGYEILDYHEDEAPSIYDKRAANY